MKKIALITLIALSYLQSSCHSKPDKIEPELKVNQVYSPIQNYKIDDPEIPSKNKKDSLGKLKETKEQLKSVEKKHS